MVWSRAAWSGSQRTPIGWGGDPQSDWEGLAASLRSGRASARTAAGPRELARHGGRRNGAGRRLFGESLEEIVERVGSVRGACRGVVAHLVLRVRVGPV